MCVSVTIARPAGEKGAGNKGSSSSTATFNLIKNILGAGVLSLPSGVAAFSKNPYVRSCVGRVE